MDQNEKLDLILAKLQKLEEHTDKEKLDSLAKKYWGFSDSDIAVLYLAKKMLENVKNTEGKILKLAMEILDIGKLNDGNEQKILTFTEK